MNMLVITNQVPYFPGPAVEAGLFCMIRELAKRHEVSLLVSCSEELEPTARAMERFCKRVVIIPTRSWEGTQARRTIKRGLNHLGVSRMVNWAKGAAGAYFTFSNYLFEEPQLVQWMKTGYVPETLEKILDEQDFDIVQVVHSVAAFWVKHLSDCRSRVLYIPGLHWFSDYRSYEVSRSPLRKMSHFLSQIKLRRYEVQACEQFDHCIVLSDDQKQTLRRFAPTAKISVVPYGIDTAYYSVNGFQGLHQTRETSSSVVFTGLMGRYENADAVLYFHRRIYPLLSSRFPQMKFLIVGAGPSREVQALSDGHSVIVTGGVEDVRLYIAQATAVIVPLRVGTGVRVKILEAMAMGTPVVSTSIGCEGLDVVDGQHLLVADTPQAFADRVAALFSDAALRATLSQSARQLVEEKYDWRVLVPQFESIYAELMSRVKLSKAIDEL